MKQKNDLKISSEDIRFFGRWSHDVNPLHMDADVARRTFFGKPIAHGILTVIESISAAMEDDDGSFRGLEAEFRRPVYPEQTYRTRVKRDGDGMHISVEDEQGACLIVRLSREAGEGATEGSRKWLGGIPDSKSLKNGGIRKEAADRNAEDFEHGMEFSGLYPTETPPAKYVSGDFPTPTLVRLLGLCSYIVGMEIPGLRSLFTRLRLDIKETDIPADTLAYRVRTTKYNSQFRTLQTMLEVATLDGALVATGELRSYVRFSPQATNLALLKTRASEHRESLEGKVALVCGGSRGLGADISASLALAGCHVYASHLTESEALDDFGRAVGKNGLNLTFLKGDAGDSGWCKSASEKIRKSHGKLDILVLNACSSPLPIGIASDAASMFSDYVGKNLRLVQQPLTTFLPMIEDAEGVVVGISSSFVTDPPAEFGHYVALKQAVEGVLKTAAKDFPNVSYCIPRPPRLRTSWNDTPTGVMGAMAVEQAALGILGAIAKKPLPGSVEVVSEFPKIPTEETAAAAGPPDFLVAVSASFTAQPLIPGLRFWLRELEHNAAVEIAPYGQVLQELINPFSTISGNKSGFNAIFLRVKDWLRELSQEKITALDYIDKYLEKTTREFIRAMRTHRTHTKVETILILCPSVVGESAPLNTLIRRIESDLLEGLKGIPGLETVVAEDFHFYYDVDASKINDPLREKIAHIPYLNPYYHTLATIFIRHMQRRLVPLRKVMILDCDNTLWDGVVGEVGAEGVMFNDAQKELHALLTRLSQGGIVVCLCSKNEDFDVWSVFDNRPDFGLDRENIVAAMINWNPKSANIRQLASKLNLGLDSFVFIDDNPVECAEVRAACPQVLTLQWPREEKKALRLLRHAWELDIRKGTKEDAKRTRMYREEFKRQELLDDNISFADFIKSLDLKVDLRELNQEDLPRASQLTMRVNQFNFTTIRRKESELKELMDDHAYECSTIRVHDRFGDYGLVGFFIAKKQGDTVELDTFLLSCRILGRGVEHHLMARLGRIATENKAKTVKMVVKPTPRNTPAREFLKSITPEEYGREDDTGLFECEVPSDYLAELKFQPEENSKDKKTSEQKKEQKKEDKEESETKRMRSRESQIERAAYELHSVEALSELIDGREGKGSAGQGPREAISEPEVAKNFIYEVFGTELGMSTDKIRAIDRLETLGCDSFKIVEITVLLIEQFPWLPITLLFEHRSVSDIAEHIASLIKSGKGEASLGIAPLGDLTYKPRPEGAADVAVVGMDVRCANANSPEEFWELLREGKSAIRPVSADREFFLRTLEDDHPHWAGLMDDLDGFDAEFFNIAPREAELMDPQIRLFLEVAWGALEDAGCAGKVRDTDMGVFVGKMYDDYVYQANRQASQKKNPYRSWEGFGMANRLSHFLGLKGPSFTVNTACSSSGTALHLACQALCKGECETALVGGSNLILDPDRFGQLGRLGILSPTGKCHPFGDKADGTLLGEGIGAVVLKSMEAAKRDGDRVYGVIKGTALSSGTGTVGFTVPNPNAQALAIRRSLREAGIDPRTISYVETHGTGTQLGDPIEIRGLTLAFSDKGLRDDAIDGPQDCRVGSVKPNTGHLESGAFMIGLIKVLLQFEHGELVPTITSEEPNPQIPFNLGPFSVQTRLEPWKRPTMMVNGQTAEMPRRAGLSSFGVGGANAHIVLEEPPAEIVQEGSSGKISQRDELPRILTLSGRHDDALLPQFVRLKQFVEKRPDLNFADICYTSNVAREHFDYRLALTVTEKEKMLKAAESYREGNVPAGCYTGAVKRGASASKIAFLFTGQGSQYAGMGREMYDSFPIFKEAVDKCAEASEGLLERPLLEVLFAEEESDAAELMDQTGYTQPCLFAVEYALFELWKYWGVYPDFLMGHSAGEIVALTAAGVLNLRDGLRLIAARGRLMQALPPGGKMAAIRAEEKRVAEAIAGLEGSVSIAAINGPSQIVVSGHGKAINELLEKFDAEDIDSTILNVSHAFHSPLIEPMLEEYESVHGNVRPGLPSVPVVSCVDGKFFDSSGNISDYWRNQVRKPVRFLDAMETLDRQEAKIFLEIGPHPVLLGMGRVCLPYENRTWLPSMRRNGNGVSLMVQSLASLYVNGIAVDWDGFNRPSDVKRVPLPTYPFRHRKYWIEGYPERESRGKSDLDENVLSSWVYDIRWLKKDIRENIADSVATKHGKWLVFGDESGVGDEIQKAVQQRSMDAVMVRRGPEFARSSGEFRLNPASREDFQRFWKAVTEEGGGVRGVVHLWSLDLPDIAKSSLQDFDTPLRVLLSSAANLTKAIKYSGPSGNAPVWFVTRNAVFTEPEQNGKSLSLQQAPVWGFGRVLALEQPEIWGGLIDLPAKGMETKIMAEALLAEFLQQDGEDQVAIRSEGRFVPRLLRREKTVQRRLSLDPKGSYLITGGGGALGGRLARWMVERGAKRLMIVSRRGAADSAKAGIFEKLKKQGVDVEYVAADVASRKDMENLRKRIEADPQPLKGIAHLAGIDRRIPISSLDEKEFQKVLAPKIQGGWLLHEIAEEKTLDFFLLFSSIASILGSEGRAHYAAANSFLDTLAQYRILAGLPATVINWGPWKGGGMASKEDLALYERMGNQGLDPAGALSILEQVMAEGKGQTVVVDIDWPRFKNVFFARKPRPMVFEIDDFGNKNLEEDQKPMAEWRKLLAKRRADQRSRTLADLIREEAAKSLGFEDPEEISNDLDFQEMGMDSLRAVDLSIRVREKLGLEESLTLYDYPNISNLAETLVGKMDIKVFAETFEEGKGGAKVIGYSPEIEKDILDFYRTAWPNRPKATLHSRWRWMFIDSAKRLEVPPQMWVCRESSSVVAFTGAIPVKLKVDEKEINTAWCVDTMVLESCRNMGLGPKIMVQVSQDLPFALSLGQTKEMRDILERLGWRQVAPFETYVYALRPHKILQKKMHGVLAGTVGAGLQIIQYTKRLKTSKRIRPLEMKAVGRFGEHHDDLWRSVKKEYKCAVVRDASYLNWKYVDQPGQDYICLEFWDKNCVVAVAVLITREPGPNSPYLYRRAFIVDLLAPPSDEDLILSALEKIRQKCIELKVDSIIFELINDRIEKSLKSFGFIKRDPTRFFWAYNDGVRGIDAQAVLTPEDWTVLKGDSDVDRPGIN